MHRLTVLMNPLSGYTRIENMDELDDLDLFVMSSVLRNWGQLINIKGSFPETSDRTIEERRQLCYRLAARLDYRLEVREELEIGPDDEAAQPYRHKLFVLHHRFVADTCQNPDITEIAGPPNFANSPSPE